MIVIVWAMQVEGSNDDSVTARASSLLLVKSSCEWWYESI